MKKLLLIIFAISAFTVSAQENSSATWEETVDFINNQSDYYYSKISQTDNKNFFNQFIINGEVLSIELEPFYIKTVDLVNLKSISFHSDSFGAKNSLTLVFIGPNVNTEYLSGAHVNDRGKTYKQRSLEFNIEDDIVERVKKAFDHLVHLASQKRKLKNKSSKF